MACVSEEVVSVPVMVKLNKISSYLSSFQAENLSFKRKDLHLENADNQPGGNSCSEENETNLPQQQNERVTTSSSLTSDKIKVYYCTDVTVAPKRTLNNFGCRLKTFGDVRWMLPTNIVSVYECVRRGWYLHQQDMLCCWSCNEMLCLQLPPSHSPSYGHAVSVLRDRVLTKHKGNCRYLSCAEPVAMSRPPSLLTTPHLYSLAAAAHQLASRASLTAGDVRLPYLENRGKATMDRLGVSSSLLQEVWGSVSDDGWQHVAVLLALCGWKATTAPDTIRCELCQRSIGFWHFLSYAEHQQREVAEAASVLSELGQPTTETTGVSSEASADGTSDKSQAMVEDTEDMSQKTEDESSTAKSGDGVVAASTEEIVTNEEAEEGSGPAEEIVTNEEAEEGSGPAEEILTNEEAEEGKGPADSARPDEDAAASDCKAVEESVPSKNESQDTEMKSDCDSREKIISNKDEVNNITESSEPEKETETRNKRKRSECEDDSSEEDPSKLVSEGNSEGSEALPSKRSKPHEDNQSPDCGDPLPASPAVSVEQSSTTPSAVAQVPSKPLFCPFSQHRYWCGWITSQKEHLMSTNESVASSNINTSNGGSGNRLQAQDTISEAHSDAATSSPDNVALDALLGYHVFAHQLKSVLQLAQGKQWTSSDKYAKTIDGLRSLRAHLTSWAK